MSSDRIQHHFFVISLEINSLTGKLQDYQLVEDFPTTWPSVDSNSQNDETILGCELQAFHKDRQSHIAAVNVPHNKGAASCRIIPRK